MRYLRTNTATIVTVGPFLDKTDGVTLETALTITNEKISFVVDTNDGSAPTLVLDNVTGATSGTANDLNYITNCDAGLMQLELAAANVNYVGRAFLTITDAANHCPVFHEFMILPAVIFDAMIAGTDLFDVSVTQIAGSAVSTSTAQLGVNAVQLGGTAQTGRDVGASVLLSPGTGAGQLDVTSGVVKANLVQILASAISGTAAQISAAFTKFFDKAAPTGTINSLPDAVAGTAGGVFIAGTNAATAVTTALTANITGNVSGSVGSVTGAVGSVAGNVGGSVASVAANGITATSLAADAVDEILDEVVEGTLTLRHVLRILLAAAAGKAAGGETTSVTFRDQADTKNRIAMTVNEVGDRSAVTLDAS